MSCLKTNPNSLCECHIAEMKQNTLREKWCRINGKEHFCNVFHNDFLCIIISVIDFFKFKI